VQLLNRKIYSLLGILMVLAFLVPAVSTASASEALVARARFCTITTPADGATVSGTIDIDIDAWKTAKLYLDGVYQGRGNYWSWDTTAVADGVHTIYASTPGASDTNTITVDNGVAPPPVNEAPVVTITSPTNGATVADTISISVDVADEDTLTPDIYIDGTYVTTAASFNWDTTAYDNGVHTIYAYAVDSGDLSDSDEISVTVDNTVAPPPPPADGDDYFSGTVAYGAPVWHYIDAGFGSIDCELYNFNNDVDMYLYRPSDYSNYVVRAYTTNNPEVMSFDADEAGLWGIRVVMYTSGATSDYDLHVTYTPNTPDTTAPTCVIDNPVANDVVYKTEYIQVTATDDRQIDYVEFYVDGALVGTDSGAPYSYGWDTTTVNDGAHVIGAIAYDAAGNYDVAADVNVVVDQSAAPAVDVVKYAVIVGISDYKAISDLTYCDEDASDWYNFITGSLGFLPENIVVLGDSHTNNYPQWDGYATEANIKAALNNMLAVADDDDTVAFITSGHGAGDGRGNSYICAWDCGSGEDGEDGDFNDYELADVFSNSIADNNFIFIDHCYSGGMGPELMALSNAGNIYVATTCTDDGYGWDDPDSQNGLWTHWFLEASWISHYGSDPSVSLEDVFAYAHDNYTKSGGDEPQEFDGDGAPMYL
jgi:hypothetical protein